MKKEKTGIILVLIFLIGVSLLLYPALADFWNQKVQSGVIEDMNNSAGNIDEDQYKAIFEEAEKYNQDLSALDHPLEEAGKLENYDDVLNQYGNGAMGILTISRINVELPIYHGTSDTVLSSAVGHMEGTSLPIAGMGTHSVLTAHRGLPSAKLFTHLDELEIGDTFVIRILDRVYTYEVDQIRIVRPYDLDEIKIDKEKEYCTLLTCTPYGINTHRLLVRGIRIENIRPPLTISTQAFQIDSLLAAPAVAAPILLILLIYLLIKYRKPKEGKFWVAEIFVEEYMRKYDFSTLEKFLAMLRKPSKRVSIKAVAFVNLDDLAQNFKPGETVSIKEMKQKGLVNSNAKGIKILADGEINIPLTIIAAKFSQAAVEKICKAGGKAIKSEK